MKKQKGFGTIYMVLAGVILSMVVGGWLYYKDTQATIADLLGQNIILNIQLAEDLLIIAQAKEDTKKQKIINTVINKEFHNSRIQVEKLQGVLKKKNKITGKQRDIGKLAIHRPKTLGKIFTKGTAKAMRCVELVSGVEHTTNELEATRRSQINDLCTELANPNYLPY